MNAEWMVRGSIVDSWLERGGAWRDESRVVIQVAPQGRPGDICIIEAAPQLLPDDGWLADLGENMCHGSPVAVAGHVDGGGHITATRLYLER